jgi:tetratricopeptide (TPR) repeat protein
VKYYSNDLNDFPSQVFHFIVDGHLTILAVFVAAGAASVIYKLLKREPAGNLIPLIWSLSLFLAYWKNLPHLYQNGRYLMPVLPFVILLGLGGVVTVIELGKKAIAAMRKPRGGLAFGIVICSVIAAQFAWSTWQVRDEYAEYCKYISDRQVKTAHWLHDNLPEGSIIATHDIGAIAFYSGRRIADLVGLVSPEMINNLGRLDKLMEFMAKKRVTHLAVLRNWFEIVNQNALFRTDERTPEIMEVFEFNPTLTHITPRTAGDLTNTAEYYLSMGNVQQAGPLLEQAVQIDSYSSKAHFLLGSALLSVGKLDGAEAELTKALHLHPDYWDARLGLAQLCVNRGRPQEAVARLDTIVQQNPSYAPGYGLLARIYKTSRLDSVKAEQYLRRYQELSKGPTE